MDGLFHRIAAGVDLERVLPRGCAADSSRDGKKQGNRSNATRSEYHGPWLIHELFEQQVERTPEAIAVTHNGRSLTYSALNQRANRLARYLRDNRVRPDDVVGVCVERGLDMVVAL